MGVRIWIATKVLSQIKADDWIFYTIMIVFGYIVSFFLYKIWKELEKKNNKEKKEENK